MDPQGSPYAQQQAPVFHPDEPMFVQVTSPTQTSARLWNTAVGQLVGAAAGLIGVHLALSAAVPPFVGEHPLAWARVLAVAIAVALTVLGETALRATSPAGGATALVLAIGAETADWAGAFRMVAAILLVTVLGEMARRVMLRRE